VIPIRICDELSGGTGLGSLGTVNPSALRCGLVLARYFWINPAKCRALDIGDFLEAWFGVAMISDGFKTP